MYRTRRKSGFTLVEILIVVIILGILAAIVIPQFTNASQDARKNSLTSQLQTIRSQLSLSGLQHRDVQSPALVAGGVGTVTWNDLTIKTNDSWTTDAAAGPVSFGPDLNSPPTNPLNGNSDVVLSTSATEPVFGGASGGTSTTGWVFHVPTGKIFATTKLGDQIYDEGTGTNSDL